MTSHSAEIDIYLLLPDGRRLDVRSCGPTECTLREPADLPPCEATSVVVIDGREHPRVVRLKGGSGVWVEFEAA